MRNKIYYNYNDEFVTLTSKNSKTKRSYFNEFNKAIEFLKKVYEERISNINDTETLKFKKYTKEIENIENIKEQDLILDKERRFNSLPLYKQIALLKGEKKIIFLQNYKNKNKEIKREIEKEMCFENYKDKIKDVCFSCKKEIPKKWEWYRQNGNFCRECISIANKNSERNLYKNKYA